MRQHARDVVFASVYLLAFADYHDALVADQSAEFHQRVVVKRHAAARFYFILAFAFHRQSVYPDASARFLRGLIVGVWIR